MPPKKERTSRTPIILLVIVVFVQSTRQNVETVLALLSAGSEMMYMSTTETTPSVVGETGIKPTRLEDDSDNKQAKIPSFSNAMKGSTLHETEAGSQHDFQDAEADESSTGLQAETGSDDEEDDDEEDGEHPPPLSQLYSLPHFLSSEEAYRNHVPEDLRQSSIDLMDNASNFGLNGSKPCNDWSKDLDSYCENPQCLRTMEIDSTILPSTTTCRTLWFSGISLGPSSECKQGGYGGLRSDYAVALRTAMHNAKDTLQPVLLVSKYLLEGYKMPPFIEWVAKQGAIVITVNEMSFQDLINSKLKGEPGIDTHIGQFLRIDIPKYVADHKLFDLPGVCDRYALYTDSDVAFVNRIRQGDLDRLKRQIDPSTDAYILYGRQTKTTRRPVNNGVMLFDVHRFTQEWPSILKFGIENFPSYSYDQMWFNNYFMSTPERMANRSTLANEWNWKSYWGVSPNKWHQVKLVHFHGPKIERGLEFMAQCNSTDFVLQKYGKTYDYLVRQGICCDRGMTAKYLLDMYYELSPPKSIRCAMTLDEMRTA